MDFIKLLDPETLATLSQLGAVTAILLIILALVWLASKLIGPFSTMSSMLRDSQASIVKSIDKMSEVVEENTRTFRDLGKVLEASSQDARRTRERLGSLQQELKEASKMLNAGVLVADAGGKILYASPQALSVLGWTAEQLPGGKNEQRAPIITALDTNLSPDDWPMAAVLRSGVAIENIPVQVYDYAAQDYKWIMVSAYPCIRCQETRGAEKASWVTLKMYELGQMARITGA